MSLLQHLPLAFVPVKMNLGFAMKVKNINYVVVCYGLKKEGQNGRK